MGPFEGFVRLKIKSNKNESVVVKHLIRDYLRDYFPGNDTEWVEVVRSSKTFAEQIEAAVMSLNSDGLMHGHQRRIGRKRLQLFLQAMLAPKNIDAVRKALRTKLFDNVYKVFKSETLNHYMVSDLTAYDITQRICAVHMIEPEFIYLHTGTTVGAKNLGLDVKGKKYLLIAEIPAWISSSLGPADIENFLCIYKDDFLRSLARGKGTLLRNRRSIC